MIKVKEAINDLRNSYELKNKKWAKTCLDIIEEELEKKNKIIDELAKEYSKYQTLKSYTNEITETAFGIKDRILKKIN